MVGMYEIAPYSHWMFVAWLTALLFVLFTAWLPAIQPEMLHACRMSQAISNGCALRGSDTKRTFFTDDYVVIQTLRRPIRR